MADTQQKVSPSTPATADEESATAHSEEFCQKKWFKVAVWLVTFVAIHGLMLLALDLTVLRVIRPKYRLQSVTIENLRVKNGTVPPSFNMQLNAQVTLKNKNFGSYKFHDGHVTFSYRGTPVGEALIIGSSTSLRSTKTMGIVLNVSSNGASRNPRLDGDIASGLLRMTANSDLRGRVRFVMLIRKYKSAKMNCDLTVDLIQKAVQDLRCD